MTSSALAWDPPGQLPANEFVDGEIGDCLATALVLGLQLLHPAYLVRLQAAVLRTPPLIRGPSWHRWRRHGLPMRDQHVQNGAAWLQSFGSVSLLPIVVIPLRLRSHTSGWTTPTGTDQTQHGASAIPTHARADQGTKVRSMVCSLRLGPRASCEQRSTPVNEATVERPSTGARTSCSGLHRICIGISFGLSQAVAAQQISTHPEPLHLTRDRTNGLTKHCC